jgi:hypothetical protein
MNPLAVGLAVAAVLAGPPLYGMFQSGAIDGTGALFRGIVVAVITAVGASWLLDLVRRYERQQVRQERRTALLRAISEAETARRPAEGGSETPRPGGGSRAS